MNDSKMVSVPRDLLETTISYAWDSDEDGSAAALQEWLARPTEQHQGEPVAWLAKTLKGALAGTLGLVRPYNKLNPDLYEGPFPVFRHSDPGEVERLRAELAERDALLTGAEKVIDQFMPNVGKCCGLDFALLNETLMGIRAALSASAEPSAQSITKPNADCAICRDLGDECMTCEEQRNSSAPVERDERAAFERAVLAEWPQAPLSRKRDLLPKDDPCYGDYCDEPLQRCWVGWRMRAWLEGAKPTVLSKCVLCDQLQADLTARDELIDLLEQQLASRGPSCA